MVEVSGDVFSFEKKDGQYKLSLGNLTTAGWFWHGDKKDLAGYFQRINRSKAKNEFISKMKKEGIEFRDIKNDVVNSAKRGSGLYETSGDNLLWKFGEGGEPVEMEDEPKYEKAIDYYYYDYDEFKRKYGKQASNIIVAQTQKADTWEEYITSLENAQYEIMGLTNEYLAEKWDLAKQKAYKEEIGIQEVKTITTKKKPVGWRMEKYRHQLAAKGIKTGRKKR